LASFLDFLEDAKRKLKQSLNTGVQQTHQFFRPASIRLSVAAQRLQAPDTRFTKVSNFMNTVGREWAVPTAKTLGNVAKIYTKATNPFYYLDKNVRRDVDNMGNFFDNFFDLSKGNLFKTTEGYDDTRAGKVAKGIGKTMAFATREIPQMATGQAIGKAVGAGALRIAPRIFRNVAPYSAIKGGTEFGTYSGLSNLLSGNDVKNSLKEAGRSFAIGSVPIGIAGNMPNFDRGGRLPRIGAGAITGAATAYLTGADPAGGAIMGGLSVAPNLSRNWLVYDADKKANIFQIRHYTDDNTFYSDATGGIASKIAKNFKELPEEKAKVYLASRKYDKLDDFINSQKDKAGNITKQGKELAKRMWEETHGVQPKVLTGKASTQKYDKLVEPKKGLDDLRGEAKKYKSAEEATSIDRAKLTSPGTIENADEMKLAVKTKENAEQLKEDYLDQLIRAQKDIKAEGGRQTASTNALLRERDAKTALKTLNQIEEGLPTKSQLIDIWKESQSLSTNKGVGANGVQPKVPISQEALSNEAKKEIDENMAKFGFKKGEYTYPKSLNQESSTVGTSQVKEVLPIKTTPLKTDTPPTTPKTETVEQAISRKVRQKSFAKAGGDNSLPSIVEKTATNVKQKVNILDYFRTPDRVMKKIGLGAEAETLRKSYDKYLDELPKEIDKVKTWAQQTSKQENKNIFRYLDGQKIQLTDKERTIANEVRGYLKDWADKLGLPKEKRITNYITHIFDKDFIQKEFPEDVAKIIKDRVAGSVYDPFVEKRLGKLGYVEDTWAALDAYVKRATRKYNLDPVLGDISKKAEKLELSQLNYVKKYIDRVNMRPTEMDNLFDNFIKSTPIGYKLGQRPTALLTRMGRQMVYRGTLGLNVSSCLKNLSQGANTYAKLGEKYTAKGYFDLAKNYRSSELQDVGVLRDNFIQDKSIGVYKSAIEKADKGLFSLFETAEKINRGAAYYGAKAKALAEGKTEAEAIEFGKKIVRDTQFTFGSIDTPVKMQADIVKLVTQFQSFTVKQGEFLGEMISKKEWAGLARWIGSSLLFVYGVGKLFGMEPKDLIPSFRFDTPATLKAPVELGKYLVGAPNRYGQPTSLKDVGQSFIQYVPGGVQGKKTIEGLQAVDAGETKSGNKLVPIAQSTKNYVRGALFGKYNLPEVQAYRELKDKVTKEVNAFKKSSDSIKPLSDGNYAVRVGDEVKKYDTEKKAQRAVNKEDFKKTGKNIQVIGDEVYRLGKEGNVTVTPKTSYDYSLNTNKMQSAKAKDDYKTWVNIANKQLGILEQQLQDPTLDELEQSDIIEKAEILMRSMQKYASYGGFTKPKSGGGRSGRSPSVTKAITMAKATPGVSKIKATTGSYNSAKSRGKIKVAVAPPSVKIPISKKYTGKQLAQMR
jgi:hypothetical protein